MTNICVKCSWQFPRGFAVIMAVIMVVLRCEFRGGFQRKIVPCPGAGHGGDRDTSLVSTQVLQKGFQRKQLMLTLYASLDVKLAYVMLRAPLLL